MRAQRGPTHALRGPRNVHKEGFSRFAARIACFPKVSFGVNRLIPIGSRATTPSPGIIFAAFGDAHKEAPKPHQSDGKDSENSHFETQSADFLPRSQGPRDKTPPPPQSQGPRAETPFPSSLPGAVRRDTLFLRSRRTVHRESIRPHRTPTAREETAGLPRLKPPRNVATRSDKACRIPARFHVGTPARIAPTAYSPARVTDKAS